MRVRRVRIGLLAAAMAAGVVAPALAQGTVSGLDALREWNLVVLGDLQSSSEVEGRTFVGGNLNGNSSNYLIAAAPASPSGQPGLTVVGDVNGSTKNLNNGAGAIVGGNVTSGFNLNGAPQTVKVGGTISNTNVNSNIVQSGLAGSDAGFLSGLQQQKSLLTSSLTDLSGNLAGLAGNSSATFASNTGTFNATPDANGVAVFNITADQLNSIGQIQFNLNGADTAIVNVSGANITLDDNFLGGTNGLGQHVIWNFKDAQTLNLSTAWGGSILAPSAAATTGNYVQGSAVFGSLVQNGEFHLGTYSGTYVPSGSSSGGSSSGGGDPSPVPEAPSIWLFMFGGLTLAAALYWRRRRMAKSAA